MKKFKLLLFFIFHCAIFCIVPTDLSAQWLETTIYVPDSLSGITRPQAFTYNTTNNKIYVGGKEGDCVIVIDGQTNEKVAKIPAGRNIKALTWNSNNNKIYSANHADGSVTVIDGETDSVITSIPIGLRPFALVYNPTNNKIYSAKDESGS
ncbi:MAG: YncE family protein, partial [candidate division WOR-3 bacterium]|nr:YncE family protein [candidate division WOR-3 bacterium]